MECELPPSTNRDPVTGRRLPQYFDGIDIDVCVVRTSYEEFAALWAYRQPMRPEYVGWVLTSTLDHCNLDVLRFLFDANIVRIGDVRRNSLYHLISQWSSSRYAEQNRGERMISYLLERGLDIESPLEEGSSTTLLDVVRANNVPHQIAFLERALSGEIGTVGMEE